jgi:hypothetical protein
MDQAIRRASRGAIYWPDRRAIRQLVALAQPLRRGGDHPERLPRQGGHGGRAARTCRAIWSDPMNDDEIASIFHRMMRDLDGQVPHSES